MKAVPTVRENVERVLAALGVAGSVAITKEEADRVWGWPVGDALLRHVVLKAWNPDLREMAMHYHGTVCAFREPGGVMPALQVCFHPVGDQEQYFVELDLDLAAPDWRKPSRVIAHGLEVFGNWATRSKTNQERVAELLNRRLGGTASG